MFSSDIVEKYSENPKMKVWQKIIFLLMIGSSAYTQNTKFVIERRVIGGKENTDKEIKLRPGTNQILIEATNLSIDSCIYKYRLLGLDDAWITSKYPVAHYQNLSGGHYNFEIIAISRQYETTPATLAFEVDKSFFEESWFWISLVVYVVFFLGIGIYFFSLYNLRQKLKVEEIRNRIAADLHDEVGSNLNSIAIFVELLRKKAPVEFSELLDKITNNSVETVQLMQDTIWAIQAKNDDTTKFIERMRNFATEVLSAKSIALSFKNELSNKVPNLPMEQRKNVYLIFKEAINNIVKHSKATKANVEIKLSNSVFRMTITDNGRGFDVAQNYEGNGISNFSERAEASEIQLNINSEIGKGTQIDLSILV